MSGHKHRYGLAVISNYVVPPLRRVATYHECRRKCSECGEVDIMWRKGTPGEGMRRVSVYESDFAK